MSFGALVVVAVAVIAIFGYYQTQVRPKGETVIQVGDRSFSLDYLERRLRYETRDLGEQPPEILVALLNQLPGQIVREELMRQGASEKGVDLSDEAIDAQIKRQIGVPPDADRNTFAGEYRDAVRRSGLSTAAYRDVIAATVAEEALRAAFNEEAPESAEQVRYRLIALATEDEAQAALDRLRNGEDFAVVALELSVDQASREQGGEMDWTPQGIVDPAVDEALFSLETGQHSDVITGVSALFIVEVLEKEAERETTPDQRSSLASRGMEEWIGQLRERLGSTVTLDNDQRNSIVGALVG